MVYVGLDLKPTHPLLDHQGPTSHHIQQVLRGLGFQDMAAKRSRLCQMPGLKNRPVFEELGCMYVCKK